MFRNRLLPVCVSLSVYSLSLTLASAQIVTLTPTSLSFGNQAVGTASASKSVTVKNTGTTKTLTLTAITGSGEFSKTTTCGASLAPGATCTVTVSFSPSALGSIDGAITLLDNATPGTQVVSLTGKGVAPVTLTPAILSFPSTAIGKTSKILTVTLTNSPTPLTMGTVKASGDFAISTNTCTGTIAANAKCTVSATFSPTVAGSIAGAITINDSAAHSPQIIALAGTGTGTVSNPVSFNPTSLTFASQTTGSTSVAQTVTLTNNGTTSLSI